MSSYVKIGSPVLHNILQGSFRLRRFLLVKETFVALPRGQSASSSGSTQICARFIAGANKNGSRKADWEEGKNIAALMTPVLSLSQHWSGLSLPHLFPILPTFSRSDLPCWVCQQTSCAAVICTFIHSRSSYHYCNPSEFGNIYNGRETAHWYFVLLCVHLLRI